MRETERKRVYVNYFQVTGETYRVEEEYLPGYYSKAQIIDEIVQNRVRYRGLDFVIADGHDGVRPHFETYLYKADKILTGSVGFG